MLDQVHIHGIILSGGPCSVYDKESPHVHAEVWELIKKKKIPVLGICYGMQELTHTFGGKVCPTEEREYGRAMVKQPTHVFIHPYSSV